MIFVLSLTFGILAQIRRIEVKIRAFLSGIHWRRGVVMGRNSYRLATPLNHDNAAVGCLAN